jgi:acyl-CoA thioester hydrolase
MPTWSAPVRFAEVDAQGVVFNAHYLLYCDEAMGTFCAERGLLELAARVKLVTSTLTWSGSARWGDVIDVDVSCSRVGTSSFGVAFDVRTADRALCSVETTYVNVDEHEKPAPLTYAERAALIS